MPKPSDPITRGGRAGKIGLAPRRSVHVRAVDPNAAPLELLHAGGQIGHPRHRHVFERARRGLADGIRQPDGAPLRDDDPVRPAHSAVRRMAPRLWGSASSSARMRKGFSLSPPRGGTCRRRWRIPSPPPAPPRPDARPRRTARRAFSDRLPSRWLRPAGLSRPAPPDFLFQGAARDIQRVDRPAAAQRFRHGVASRDDALAARGTVRALRRFGRAAAGNVSAARRAVPVSVFVVPGGEAARLVLFSRMMHAPCLQF